MSVAAPASAIQPRDDRSDDPIIIVGERNSAGLRADRDIGPNAIESYGVDTVRDLLGAIAAETEAGNEGPVILINGQPASGIDEVADLPTEAVAKVQLLSRDAAATLGQRPTRRVINVVIKPDHRQVTLAAKGRIATAGGGRKTEGDLNLLALHEGNRESLVLHLAETGRLDEADRDIVSAPDDLGVNRFRSLLPSALVASANGNVTRKLGPSTLSLNLRGERQESQSRTGATAAIPARRLDQAGQSTSLGAAAVANGPLRGWRYSLIANLGWRLARTASDRATDLDMIDPVLLGTVFREQARTRSTNLGLLGTLNGTPFKLPAGPAHAALRLEWRANRALSTTTGRDPDYSRRLRRDDQVAQLNLQLPLIRDKAIGELGAELSGALRHVTASGTLHDVGAALNWRPDDRFTLRASWDREQIAPPPNSLTDPLVTIDHVRVYDFIRQETVEVTYLTGGNPNLSVERRRTFAFGATWQPFDRINLNLSLDYADVVGRGAFAALPPVNADVQAAFPERFQRDSSGRLIAVDARPVPFGLVKRQELRSFVTFYRNFGEADPTPSAVSVGEDQGALGSDWRVNALLGHQWTLQSERQARSGLPLIDLLDGGALGLGGGQPRHQVQFGAGVAHRGLGLQLEGNWTGPSRIATGTATAPDELRFKAQLLVNARLYANLGALLVDRPWAKSARISLAVDNAFDSRRRVRDSSGATPLGYQHYLLDPLGRTITLALRKAF